MGVTYLPHTIPDREKDEAERGSERDITITSQQHHSLTHLLERERERDEKSDSVDDGGGRDMRIPYPCHIHTRACEV